jgi:hypothetical protein
VALSTQIHAYTSADKEHFTFDTNFTEAIKFVAIEENYIWAGGIRAPFSFFLLLLAGPLAELIRVNQKWDR